jgi:hypothetical protein
MYNLKKIWTEEKENAMEKKYEKPVARNLGEMLPIAEGLCVTVGNSANTYPPANNCTNGTSAVGGACYTQGDGATAIPVCAPGINPYDYGCISGTLAPPPHGCNPGTTPL